jgi:peptide/nickel transport system ATP-binding protein
MSDEQADRETLAWMEQVRLPDPGQDAQSFPHQLSGGMQQRVMIAMALCAKPQLLILDEPTTNLDATTQAAILDLVCELIQRHNTAAIYITHNLGVVAQICDQVSVMYAGEVVEQGRTRSLFNHPLHPYTRGLLDSIPKLGENKRELRLEAIEGRIPRLDSLPTGCIFRPRCPIAIELCRRDPVLEKAVSAREVRCHRWAEIERGDVDYRRAVLEADGIDTKQVTKAQTLDVQNLRVVFPRERSLMSFIKGQPPDAVRAVDDLSFDIRAGETFGLVGESGSGKTTAARAILGLVEPDKGELYLQGMPLAPNLRQRELEVRRLQQMVFQNPNEAFNPYLTIGESISRPLVRLLGLSSSEARKRVRGLLESVHLPAEYARRLPGSLSGGERQRAAIARAFAASPALLLADEAVSALDVSVQAAILNLLDELQAQTTSATLFISHDLAAVGYVADRIAVIYLGRLMEVARAEELFKPPYHPYTEALLSAIPSIESGSPQQRIRLSSDLPSPTEVQQGCPFHSRCPRRLGDICRDEKPPWQETDEGTHIYCHISVEELARTQDKVSAIRHDGGRSG